MKTAKPSKKQNSKPGKKAKKPISQRKWLFPLGLVLAAGAIAAVLLFLRKETEVRTPAPGYQYFLEQRYEFAQGSRLRAEENATLITDASGESEEDLFSDTTPLYYQDTPRLMLMRDISWFCPSNGREWRIPALSELEVDEYGSVLCHVGEKTVRLDGGFLHDGAGVYVLIDPAVLTLNGRKYSMSPLSFYSTTYGLTRVFSYEEQELYTQDKRQGNVLLDFLRGGRVNLSAGIYENSEGESRLLIASPKLPQSIEEYR